MLEESSLLCAESESICLPRVSKGLPEEKVFESRPEQGRIYHLGPQVLPRLWKTGMGPSDIHVKLSVIMWVAGTLDTNAQHGG